MRGVCISSAGTKKRAALERFAFLMLFCLTHSVLVPLDPISVGFSSSPVSLTLGNQFVVKTRREKPPTTPGRATVRMDWLPAPCQLPPAPAVCAS